jgi:hypothetical protein
MIINIIIMDVSANNNCNAHQAPAPHRQHSQMTACMLPGTTGAAAAAIHHTANRVAYCMLHVQLLQSRQTGCLTVQPRGCANVLQVRLAPA